MNLLFGIFIFLLILFLKNHFNFTCILSFCLRHHVDMFPYFVYGINLKLKIFTYTLAEVVKSPMCFLVFYN